jgi:hypothetical protein
LPKTEKTMITILSQQTTNRLQYACKHIFSICMGCEWEVTDHLNGQESFVIQYGEKKDLPIENMYIPSCGLVFEKGIRPQSITTSQWNGLTTLFPAEVKSDDPHQLPFDIFSAVFFLLSRYEEYTNPTKDCHGRFPAEESCAFKHGFLELPLIDLWCVKLKEHLLQINSKLTFQPPKYQFIPTIDVDNVFAYKNHGVLQTSYCCFRDFLKGKKASAIRRLKAVLRLQPDPYFNLEELHSTHKKHNCTPLFFFHCGTFGKRDKRSIFPSLSYLGVRKKISQHDMVGMHPSYHCSLKPLLFKIEKMMMAWHGEERPVRFHYLRMTLPESYELLLKEGFTSDWSLCYSNLPGFRASTSHPFLFYNLKTEQERPLTIYPTAVMDKTLKSDLKLKPEEALTLIFHIKKQVEKVGGTFITLFHNQHFAQGFGWDTWDKLYEKVLDESQIKQNN